MDQWASDFQKQREDMDTYSLRGEGSAGIENASFAFEYAWQDKDAGAEKAWYAEAGYIFADVSWSPKLPPIMPALSIATPASTMSVSRRPHWRT
ncbi:hypothetical protein D3C84_1014410 [compost metagenome]